ncbi:MAG: DUF4136 domain-containing protein [Pyrinomonadaceae bacterium]
MSFFRTFYIIGLLALAGGIVSGQAVTSTYDEDFRLSGLNTYAFNSETREGADPLATDTVTEKKIKDALDTELQSNGYHPPADAASPDFIVSFRVATKDKASEVVERNQVMGSLIVDFYDAQTRKLVWRGIATGVAGREAVDLKLVEHQVENAAKLLLVQFGKDRIGLVGFWKPIERVCERWRFIRSNGLLCMMSELATAT